MTSDLDVIEQLRKYLDYAAVVTEDPVAAMPPAKPIAVRWFRRGPVLAGLAALLTLVLAVPSLFFASDSDPSEASELPDPLAIGVDYLWPEGGFEGSQEELAAAFAREVLGWTDFKTTSSASSGRITSDAALWTTIEHPGMERFELRSIPFENDRRVVVEVGSLRAVTGVHANGIGQYVTLPPFPGADSAYLHVRFVDTDRVDVVRADQADLDNTWVDVSDDSPVAGVIVIYADDTGRAIGALGTHYGPLDGRRVSADDVTYQTYVEDGQVWIRGDCPDADTILKGGPEGLPHISSTTDREAIEEWLGHPADTRLIPRNGEVWDRSSDGSVVVTQVEDWMIERTLDDATKCPLIAVNMSGVPVFYRIAND